MTKKNGMFKEANLDEGTINIEGIWHKLSPKVRFLPKTEKLVEYIVSKDKEVTFVKETKKDAGEAHVEEQQKGFKTADKIKQTEYREHQTQVIKECLGDANSITADKEFAKQIALSFFDLRCSPKYYYEKKGEQQ